MTSTELVDRVVATLWPQGSQPYATVWAILDAARDERIYPALKFSKLEYISLYAGRLPDALLRAAPYIIELAPGYSFTRPLLEMGWGNSWGVFLRIEDARNLRHHLRGLLRVQDESGRMLVFRYYDPRVLRAYLPTCTTDELATVFGPISSFVVEDAGGEGLIEFDFDGKRLRVHRVSLVAQLET
jgi:hypothetical protein